MYRTCTLVYLILACFKEPKRNSYVFLRLMIEQSPGNLPHFVQFPVHSTMMGVAKAVDFPLQYSQQDNNIPRKTLLEIASFFIVFGYNGMQSSPTQYHILTVERPTAFTEELVELLIMLMVSQKMVRKRDRVFVKPMYHFIGRNINPDAFSRSSTHLPHCIT